MSLVGFGLDLMPSAYAHARVCVCVCVCVSNTAFLNIFPSPLQRTQHARSACVLFPLLYFRCFPPFPGPALLGRVPRGLTLEVHDSVQMHGSDFSSGSKKKATSLVKDVSKMLSSRPELVEYVTTEEDQ